MGSAGAFIAFGRPIHNSEAELRRLVQAIQTAQVAPLEQPAPAMIPTPTSPPISESAPGGMPNPPVLRAEPYRTATVNLSLGSIPMHEVYRSQLAELLAKVVETESPVHWREAARRILAGAGVQKLGSRIENAFDEAIQYGITRQHFTCRGDFLWKIGMEQPEVRDRASLPNGCRKLELVAPEELRLAILAVVQAAYGMNPVEVPTAVCRILGFARMTDEMKADIEPHLNALLKAGALKLNGQNVTVAQIQPSHELLQDISSVVKEAVVIPTDGPLTPVERDVVATLLNLGCSRRDAESAVRRAKGVSHSSDFEPLFRKALELIR